MNRKAIVIGAGAAGLAAAAELAAARLDVLVLEARERAGGRIYTVREAASETAVELGAEFLHGTSPDLWNVVRSAPELRTVETAGASWSVDEENRLKPFAAVGGDEEVWRRLEKYDAADLSFADFLENHCGEPKLATARQSALRYVEGFHAADPQRAGALGVKKAERAADAVAGDRAFRLPAGYDQIADRLHDLAVSRGAKFVFGCRVETIRWQTGAVEIGAAPNGENKIFTAACAVVTLPLGVLKAGAVEFEPPLPEAKKTAVAELEMGAAARVVLRFENDWWAAHLAKRTNGKTAKKLGFLFSPSEPLPVWWTAATDAPALTGWAGGSRAERLSGRETGFAVQTAVESLARIFGVEQSFVETKLKQAHFYDWQSDEFSRGAYSYALVGGADAPDRLAQPVADALYFAGEATEAAGHLGTVHGAIASGNRAAAQIVDFLNKNVTTA